MTLVVVGEALVDVLPEEERPGGGPANIAVGLARLGHDVTLVTALGDDPHGRLVRDHLEASGVDVLAAPIERTSTARASLDAAGVASYEFDITWIELKVLQAIGLVWDVKVARIRQPLEEAAA